VITVNPLAKVPKISRSRRGARSDVAVMELASRWIVTSPNHQPVFVFNCPETYGLGQKRKVMSVHSP
jgi:hypothetical protein